MYVLGLATMTDSAAVLLHDGRIVAAAEEERFSRVKHAGGLPVQSIRFVLTSASLQLQDVDHVAVYWNPYRVGARSRYMVRMLFRNPKLFATKMRRLSYIWSGHVGEDSGWGSLFRIRALLRRHFGEEPPPIHYLDHHDCHVASAFYGSGWEESAVLVMDGSGEAACTTATVAQGIEWRNIRQHLVPHSLGHFYSSVTGYLGFRMLDGEYKMMGLSSSGDPAGCRWIREHMLRTVGPGEYRLLPGVLDYHRALSGNFEGAFTDHFGPPRKPDDTTEFTDRQADVSAATQRAFEEVVLELAMDLRSMTGVSRLVIAGGCGLNCTANGKILASGVFDEIYVPPVPHDAGGALGAAMLLYARISGRRPDSVRHAQFGPSYSEPDIAAAIRGRGDVASEQLPVESLVRRVADALEKGAVIAWMQGPMEFGPRALGNRSFLASPLRGEIKDVLNAKVKNRELFRPFAPSVKAECATQYFEIDQPSPFMTIVVPVRPEKRSIIPAVTHIDGTARPQTVERDANPTFWRLLDEFEALTGVPVLLNTSFNIQEPIVCTPAEALTTFARSDVEALVIGSHWVTRSTALGVDGSVDVAARAHGS